MQNESKSTHDSFAAVIGKEGARGSGARLAGVLVALQPQGLYPTPAVCPYGACDISQSRPSRDRRHSQRMVGRSRSVGLKTCSPLVHPLQSTAPAVEKNTFHALLDAVFSHAAEIGKVGRKEEVSVDSTGLEAGYRSAHYAHRTGQKRYRLRNWPKLTLVAHNATHLLVHVLVTDGPSQDAPFLPKVLEGAVDRACIDRVLADAGYDAESNHVYARKILGIRSTVINLNRRGGRRWSKAKYRRQMYRRFHSRKYRQRAQIESTISRFKRRLSANLRGRSRRTQRTEVNLRVLTHDLLLLAG